MLTYESVLADNEILFLDEVISLSTLSNKDLGTPLALEAVNEINGRIEGDNLESLRIKGIIEITVKNVKSFYEYEGEELITSVDKGIISINKKELVRFWITTIFYKAGKGSQFDNDLIIWDKEGFFYPIDIGSESINVYFVTDEFSEVREKPKAVYVSFIGNLPLPDTIFCHWWNPFQEPTAAHRFFDWIKESIKRSSDKKYSFINIPTDLEPKDHERIYSLIKSVLEAKNFDRKNIPENFYPESIDYFIPDTVIEDCFIKDDGVEKIFLIKKNSRIEIHTFKNGEKDNNKALSESINKLQIFIDERAEVYRSISESTKSKLPNTLIRYTPILIMFILSFISSFGLLFSNQELPKSIVTTNTWLFINIIINIVALAFLSFITIYPHLRLFFFKWNRGLKKFEV